MTLLTVHLPAKGKILVSEGQTVSQGSLLAQGENPKRVSLHLGLLLKTKPAKIRNSLFKKIGEEIKEGEIVAQKTHFLGKRRVKSPQAGILENLDEESGILTIKTGGVDFNLPSPVEGKVKEIKENEEIIIEFKGVEIKAEKGTGPPKEGEMAVLGNSAVSLFNLSLDLAGKIVAAGIWSRETLSKARALGVEAVLGQEIEDFSLEKAELTLLLFSPENFEKVLKYNKHQAVVLGEEKSLIII